MSQILEGEFNGEPILIFQKSPEDRFPFTIRLKYCRLMVKHIEAIKAFVEKHPDITDVIQ